MTYRKKLYAALCVLCCLLGCSHNGAEEKILNTEKMLKWQEKVATLDNDAETLPQYVDAFMEYHEDFDYGVAYGVTAVLCEELDVCEVSADYTDEELAAYFSDVGQMYLLDFTLPMFETHFFDEETVEHVQAASVSFAEYVNEQGELEELYRICLSDAEEDETRLVELKNEWLANLGVENVYEPFAMLPFEYNGRRELKEYPYVMSDTEANWYFHPDDVKEYGYKIFIEEYLFTEELMTLDFPEARELFKKYLPEEVPAIDICTAFYAQSNTFAAWYKTPENRIELLMDWENTRGSLFHEYIHYLTKGVTDVVFSAGAFAEGIAEEAAVWGCTNYLQTAYLVGAFDKEEMKESSLWDEEKEQISMQRMILATAHDYYSDMLVGTRYMTVSANTIERPEVVDAIGKLSYSEMASLTHYLVEIYGRDAVYEGFYNYDSFVELVGKDFMVLYEEWGRWNKEQCDKLGIEFVYE